MDDASFDALSRSFGVGQSRRAITRLLGVFGLGGALASLGLAEAKSKKKKACPPCKKRKKGKCKWKLPDGTACPGGRCLSGTCTPASSCPSGQKPCGGACIPDARCCTNTDCPLSSPTCCDGVCVNVLTDVRHCNSCGAACGFNEQCISGTCRCGTQTGACSDGFTCCAPTAPVRPGQCVCNASTSVFLDPITCDTASSCQAPSTPCISTTHSCQRADGSLGPSRTCCPPGTMCDNGRCRHA